jgi:hypothetical protein
MGRFAYLAESEDVMRTPCVLTHGFERIRLERMRTATGQHRGAAVTQYAQTTGVLIDISTIGIWTITVRGPELISAERILVFIFNRATPNKSSLVLFGNRQFGTFLMPRQR